MSDLHPELRVEQSGPVQIITFDAPERRNALTPELELAFHQQLDISERDDSVRAIVLTGAGESFCSGYSFGVSRDADDGTAAAALRKWYRHDMQKPYRMMHIMQLDKPVIAAVNGWCLGGGFWYALCSDITICDETATFGQPEVRHVSASSLLLAVLSGWKNAHRYGLTGDHFDAAEAHRIGVVNDVVPGDQLLQKATELAERIARVPMDAVRLNKATIGYGLEAMGLRNGLNMMGALSAIVHASNDTPEVAEMYEARRSGDVRRFLKLRDEPFRPEPGGPRSADAPE